MFSDFVAQVPDVPIAVPLLGVLDASPYLVSVGVFLALSLLFFLVQKVVLARLSALSQFTETDLDDALIRALRGVHGWALLSIALTLALKILTWPAWFDHTLTAVALALVLFEAIRAVSTLINYGIGKFLARREGEDGEPDPQAKTAAQMITLVAKIALWSFGLLFVLSNLGVEITSLIAGLGIGGIAVGLALQSILGDLFSSFAIYFDRPFEVGDFIIVGEHSGTVERIGIKTTRVRALQGEEIVFSNSELTSARIHNYKRMNERRISFTFGITYETPYELVAKVPESVRAVFESIEEVRFDRVHFFSLGDSALIFEVVYYVLDSDYAVYMDVQQRANLGLVEALGAKGIDFAYPTQTHYVHTVAG